MKAKFGIFLMLLGAVLIFGALGLFTRNQQEATTAEESSQILLAQLVQQIHEDIPEETMGGETEPELDIPTIYMDPIDFIMPEVVVNGRSYIGYLSIPSLSLDLPIMSGWDYPSLQIAPCRYYGTVKEKNLVLMAHNYPKHFGRISELNEGDSVIFTDVEGNATAYQVVARDILNPQAVTEMTSGAYDLTLFTCTYGGRSRVTVYCDMS